MRLVYYKILSFSSFIFKFFYKNRLRVLAYHDIKDKHQFYQQIKYLKEKYQIISVEDLKDYFEKKIILPPRALLITFDDGDISILDQGLPVLKKLKLPSCLFIITSLINSNTDFWFNAVRKTEKENGKSPDEINQLMNDLKNKVNSERLMEIEKYNFPNKKQLSSEDLLTLKRNGVFIGNHSHTHPMFNRCTKTELQEEFRNTKAKFKEFKIEEGFEVFAYPNGNWDINSEKVLKETGIKLSFLFDHKVNEKKINPLRISRIRTNSDISIEELQVKVSGLHSFLQSIKRAI